jgi:DNA modification methylase
MELSYAKRTETPHKQALDLLAYPIRNSSPAEWHCVDTVAGSFSTGIACEQTDRICVHLKSTLSMRLYVLDVFAISNKMVKISLVIEMAKRSIIRWLRRSRGIEEAKVFKIT